MCWKIYYTPHFPYSALLIFHPIQQPEPDLCWGLTWPDMTKCTLPFWEGLGPVPFLACNRLLREKFMLTQMEVFSCRFRVAVFLFVFAIPKMLFAAKCTKKDVCSCETSDGKLVSLWSIDGGSEGARWAMWCVPLLACFVWRVEQHNVCLYSVLWSTCFESRICVRQE